ncbi:hypothetical protein EL22_09970 [Halostagnicola sp. A56]|nr:hypothetical protein EL22_09970 [Halostagnicola sp. A56]
MRDSGRVPSRGARNETLEAVRSACVPHGDETDETVESPRNTTESVALLGRGPTDQRAVRDSFSRRTA